VRSEQWGYVMSDISAPLLTDVSLPITSAMTAVVITGETTHVASVYLARWSAPIKVNGVAIGHGTGHEFGWDDTRWVSLGAFRRGGPRPGQWGERARKRRAKRRERAGHIRSYKRFDRYLDTRQGQNWSELENARDAHLETVAAGDTANIQSGTGGIHLASGRTADLGNEREDT